MLIWNLLSILAGLTLIVAVLWEAFETILLPRTATRRVRFTRYFFRALWTPWAAIGCRMQSGSNRERYLGLFGPLSILVLIGCWAGGLVAGFGLLQWVAGPDATPGVIWRRACI